MKSEISTMELDIQVNTRKDSNRDNISDSIFFSV